MTKVCFFVANETRWLFISSHRIYDQSILTYYIFTGYVCVKLTETWFTLIQLAFHLVWGKKQNIFCMVFSLLYHHHCCHHCFNNQHHHHHHHQHHHHHHHHHSEHLIDRQFNQCTKMYFDNNYYWLFFINVYVQL